MTQREIILFETDAGKCPPADYIKNIQRPSERAKITKVLEAVGQVALMPSHFFKKMQGRGELWEVRVLQHRLLGFHTRAGGTGPQEFVIVHAFQKQSQKTPLHEIEVALRRRDAYLARRGDPQ